MAPKLLFWCLTASFLIWLSGSVIWGWQAESWQWILWTLTCVLFAWAQYRRLLWWYNPIDRFQRQLHRISAGSYDSLLGMHGYGTPWPQISEAFQAMREALRQREQSLRDTNQRMESVLGSMIEGVLAVDDEENIILLNREAKRMLAVDQVDVLGRGLREVARHPELIQAVTKARQEQQPVFSEFVTARTPRRVLSIRVTPLPNEQADGLTIVLEDITELRQLESMRRDFVANVSHELKTPLTAIKAYAETLRLGAISDPVHCMQFIEQIESQSDRLHQLILDLLHLSRVESGKASFEICEIDLAEICRNCLQVLSEQAQRSEIKLELVPTPGPIRLQADAEAIRMIVDNLLVNAIRYTPAGGRVQIRCRVTRGWVILEVSDTGIGIAPEHHERIFERFYRVDKARSRDVGGTGLGLSIVKHLAHSFGGTVEVESKIGEGSTFRVRLPIGGHT